MKPPIHQLQALCDALLDERITPKQTEQLQDLLANSLEARREYVRLMGLSSSLHLYAAEEQIPRIHQPEEGAVISSSSGADTTSPSFWNRPEFVATAAAVVILATGLFFAFRAGAINNPPTPNPQASSPGASLASANTPDWRVGGASGNRISLSPSDPIPSGPVHLASGMAELAFDGGASVLLQGPTTIEVIDGNSMRALSGKMAADLSNGADGFVTFLPNGSVVDHGTGFGLEIDDQNRSEVHTLAGQISFDLEGGSLPMSKGDASRVEQTLAAPEEVEEVPFDASRFPTDVNTPGGSSKFVFMDDFNTEVGVPPALGSTAWEDNPANQDLYQVEGDFQVDLNSGSETEGLLLLQPNAEKESRITMLRDFVEMAGQRVQIRFKGSDLLEDGSTFGLALGSADENQTHSSLRAELSFQQTTNQISVRLLSAGEIIHEQGLPMDGVHAILFLVEFDLTGEQEDGQRFQVTINDTELGWKPIKLNAQPQVELFGAPHSSGVQQYFFDDLSIRQL